MDNWQPVFKDSSPVRAEIVKAILGENDISAVVLNKQESVYKLHGAFEVLVPKNDFLRALNIVKNEITF